MLPKIITGRQIERNVFFAKEKLNESDVLLIDGKETNLLEFREWINFCRNVVDVEGKYSVVIFNAGDLSAECQNVLLKPLEEKNLLTKMYLIVEKELDLIPTVLSRCEVVGSSYVEIKEDYWKDLISCWRGGPGYILDYVEKFDLDKLPELFDEVIFKIKSELRKEVKVRRIDVMEIVFDTLKNLDHSNVSKRMALESFLLRSWKVIKA